MNMAYVTSWERHGIKQGEITMLLQQLQHKFKMVPDSYRQKIEQADSETLLLWGNRILDNNNLEEIFKA